MIAMNDIRNLIFQKYADDWYIARITAERDGILSGVAQALAVAEELGITVMQHKAEGDLIAAGDVIFTIYGIPIQLAKAEDRMIGAVAAPSGVATAARRFCEAAGESVRVVCGSWKKLPEPLRDIYRQAVITGGCATRMLDEPMVYLDKNYVAMFGAIEDTLNAVNSAEELKERKKVVQVKGRTAGLAAECWEAARYGADVIYVDTGDLDDMAKVLDAMEYMETVPQIAFGGNVTLDMMERIKSYPIAMVGVGKAIIDVPMIDMCMDVVPKQRPCHCGGNHDH